MPTVLSAFAKYVRPEVPECPEIMVLDAILQAGIDFCKQTRIFKESILVTTQIGVARYPLLTATPLQTAAEEILFVKRDENDSLEESSFYDFEKFDYSTTSGTPHHFYLDVDDVLVLGSIPSAIETLEVKVKTRPIQTATTLPNELASRYLMEIAAGAVSILQQMSKQPWYDLQGAGMNQIKFNNAISAANLREAEGGSKKVLRTTSHQF